MPTSSTISPVLRLALLLNASRDSHTSTMQIPSPHFVTQWDSAFVTIGPPGGNPQWR